LLRSTTPTLRRGRRGAGAIGQTTLTGSADEIGRRVSEFAARGITEIIYQPTGPYITRELKAFHAAARSAVSAAAQGHTTT